MKLILAIGVLFSIQTLVSSKDKEEPLSDDVLCAGCEAFVKALSSRLSYGSKEKLEKEVPEALRTICDEENYKDTEFSPSKVKQACKQLLKKRKTDITTALVAYYNARKQSKSYLELSRRICTQTVGVCDKRTDQEKSTEGKVIFNDETQEFEVIMGDNVRIPGQPRPGAQRKKQQEMPSIQATPIKLQKPAVENIDPLKENVAGHDEL